MASDDRQGERFPIVAIGASAGGLAPLSEFFDAAPDDSGMAFVVVQHLSPSAESHAAELLGSHTRMPVVEVREETPVRPNHAYIIMPDQTLTIRGGALRTTKRSEPAGRHHPVDVFFRSLAEDRGDDAVCIVMSGTGSNGSEGLKAVKERGGAIFAQTPETAEHDGMPRNAIATGLVDRVLAPHEMPEALSGYAGRQPLPAPAGDGGEESEPDRGFARLLALVRSQTGMDFSGYKTSSLMRRAGRRMRLANVGTEDDYAQFLRSRPEEMDALVKDLLIAVTAFFRDPRAWETLARDAVAPVVKESSPYQAIRAWAPGCATGEEAYSLAMLLFEQAAAADKPLDIKVFATDASESALRVARDGVYPAAAENALSQERLRRFFDLRREDSHLRVKEELRDSLVCAVQNLMQDPPFSRLDLISCRNLLIYLKPEMQRKVIALMHFALREGGYLFLGSAETIGGRDDLFETVSRKWRIYRRLGSTRHDIVEFPVAGSRAPHPRTVPPAQEDRRPPGRPGIGERAQKTLADRYAPASVVIDRRYEVLHFHGATDPFLVRPPGEPTNDLLDIMREGLRMRVRSAVQRAIDGGEAVSVRGRVRRDGRSQPVCITAEPLSGRRDDGLMLVSFADETHETAPAPVEADESPREREMEEDNRLLRDELRDTVERSDRANEDLRASNEEIVSINEELQASNEELETSKEELQSLNEELTTLNAQLNGKVEELQRRTDDLNNLLNGTDIATLFLDRELRIRWFTPAMETLLGIVDSDIGRPVSDFARRFEDDDLMDDADAVLRNLAPRDREVLSDDGSWYIRRLLPYRTGEDRIEGVVATFVDITGRRRSEEETRLARAFSEAIVDTVREPLLILGPELRVRSANRAFYSAFRVAPAETEGTMIYELGNGQWDIPELRRLLGEILPENETFDDFEVECEFEAIGRRVVSINARRLDEHDLILMAVEDVTEAKEAGRHRDLLMDELSHRVKNTLTIVQSLAAQTAKRSGSIGEFSTAFQARLRALAETHGHLMEEAWRGADLRTLIDQTLTPYVSEAGRVKIQGDPAVLSPRQALSLNLSLHELAMNAAKYGALSVPTGALAIRWNIETEGNQRQLRLLWCETGVPGTGPPTRKGFGTTLIEQTVSYELKGQTDLRFEPDGLRAEIAFALE